MPSHLHLTKSLSRSFTESMAGRGKKHYGHRSLPKRSNSRSLKAGLLFPVSRIARYLNDENKSKRVDPMAPIFFAGVLESLAVDLLVRGRIIAWHLKKTTIETRELEIAVRNDPSLNKVFTGILDPNFEPVFPDTIEFLKTDDDWTMNSKFWFDLDKQKAV